VFGELFQPIDSVGEGGDGVRELPDQAGHADVTFGRHAFSG
jgi:hypothetical protein